MFPTMKEPIIGKKINQAAIDALIDDAEKLQDAEATLYIGYPVIATADEPITIPALYVSSKYGLIVFDVLPALMPANAQTIAERQDSIALALSSKLLQYKGLSYGRSLGVTVNVLTYFPDTTPELGALPSVATPKSFVERVRECTAFDAHYLPSLNAAIERVANIKPKAKRENAKTPKSRGSILKEIEAEIANLDAWQKSAAIEIPDGPQRIRGLAGSGKTIVLALKAAYLHGQNPDWNIVVTFHSRALKQQFKTLIRRFYFEDYHDEPDWSKVRILHSFGSPAQPGLYSEICRAYDVVPKDFSYARNTYGRNLSFQGICQELLSTMEQQPHKVLFEAILIDEAQDLPKEFLRIAHMSAERNRIVWAYDDLQNLGAYELQSLLSTFGEDEQGNQVVVLHNRPKQPKEDIILPRCYRNTPWALVTAHSLGSGIYRGQLVQHPDDPKLWEDIGYRVREGTLQLGSPVVLERDPAASPPFFFDKLTSNDAVVFLDFRDDRKQLSTVADMIIRNITTDELLPQDIVVIFPDAIQAATRGAIFQQHLRDRGIASHVTGVTTSRDIFFIDNSIAISGPFRAKGNEAAMIYLLDAEYCAAGSELIKRRNTLFTAITRSRAWVRVCGVGSGFAALEREFRDLLDNAYRLRFTIPTLEELKKMRTQYRDISKDEQRDVESFGRSAEAILSRAGDDTVALIQSLPKDLREKLLHALREAEEI